LALLSENGKYYMPVMPRPLWVAMMTTLGGVARWQERSSCSRATGHRIYVDPGARTVIGHTGDDQEVRGRGTIGGSLAHGDAASDLPTAVLALGGTMVIHGPRGVRSVAATEFFKGPFTTAIEPDEILVEVRLPRPSGPGWAYQRFTHRAYDWPIVAVATVDGRVALANSAETVIRAHATEDAISAGASIRDAAQLADREATPRAHIHGSIDYHRHLIRVLTERALQAAAE
jgi:carbon-monoxide dehydrogenase medium subunit